MWNTTNSLAKQILENQAAMDGRINDLEKKCNSHKEVLEIRIGEIKNQIFEFERGEMQEFQKCIQMMNLLENRIESNNKSISEIKVNLEKKINDTECKIICKLDEKYNAQTELINSVMLQMASVNEKLQQQHNEYMNIYLILHNIIKELEEQKESNFEMLKAINEAENITGDNIATISSSLQEIMSFLLALDEGNRLIIAKMLLQDMEV